MHVIKLATMKSNNFTDSVLNVPEEPKMHDVDIKSEQNLHMLYMNETRMMI